MRLFTLFYILFCPSLLPALEVKLSEIVAYAATKSDEAKRLQLPYLSKNVSQLQLEAALAPKFSAKLSATSNENENAGGAFSPEKIDQNSLTIGVQKLWSSGTLIGTEWSQDDNEILYPDPPGGGPSFTPDGTYQESKFSVFLRQSLWKNAFGSSTSRQIEAADLSSLAVDSDVQAKMEEFIATVIGQYYDIWLLQTNYKAAQARLKRQKRLLSVSKVQLRRGTLDKADYLQLEAATLGSEQSIEDFERSLNDAWNLLSISLGLPETFRKPEWNDLKLSRDADFSLAMSSCRAQKAPVNAEVKTLSLNQRAAQLRLEASRSEAKPDLFFEARYGSNGIDDKWSPTASDALGLKNPQLSLALGIDWAIGGAGDKANLLQAYETEQTLVLAQNLKQTALKIQWQNNCGGLKSIQNKVSRKMKTLRVQKNRNQLEQKRFRYGQVEIFNVIQAGNDETAAEVEWKSAEADLDRLVWKVIRDSGQLKAYVTRSINSLKTRSTN